MIAAAATVGLVLVGVTVVISQMPGSDSHGSAYSGIVGRGCGSKGATFTENGYYEDGDSGWIRDTTGGYTGDGCSGQYDAVPMSGSAAKDDGNSAVWTFTADSLNGATCKVQVHVPDNPDVKRVGGRSTFYSVHPGAGAGANTLGTFDIDQVENRGKWFTTGQLKSTGRSVAVVMHTRGEDADGAHHAADVVKLNCGN
ncbi:hypothetical protein [Streptomyces lunalinharesii]